MRRLACASFACLLAACAARSPSPASPASPAVTAAPRRYRAPPSGAVELVRSLSDEVGPRLAGSPGDARAVAWGLRTMRALGLTDVRAEPVRVPRWERGEGRGEIVSPYPHAVSLAALGGSVATPPEGIEAEVVEAASLAGIEALPDEVVRGRIVYVHEVMQRARDGHGYGTAVTVRGRGAVAAARKGAVALLIRSIGTDRSRNAHTGAMRYDDAVPRIPAAALSTADADTLHRIVRGGVGAVRFRLVLGCRSLPEAESANVVGEVQGTSRAHEVVLLGAHLDAWDLGTGALDDGAGVALVLTAARALRQREARPLRTVRVVLFANEENGLAGARAYAAAHEAELARHVVAMEADAGDGRVYALRFAGGDEGAAEVRRIADALAPMDVAWSDARAHGGADLSTLTGVPWIDLSQDMTTYFDHHHTANDTPAVVDPAALDQAAAVWSRAVAELASSEVPLGRRAESPR